MKKKLLIIVLLFPLIKNIQAQTNDSISPSLIVWGFADFYYAYDFNIPASHDRPSFIYSHQRHNEFALNNGIIGLKYNKEKYNKLKLKEIQNRSKNKLLSFCCS